MSSISNLEMPTELKERIEKAARERNQNPSSLVERAFALFLYIRA